MGLDPNYPNKVNITIKSHRNFLVPKCKKGYVFKSYVYYSLLSVP